MSKRRSRSGIEKTLPRCTNILPDGKQCTNIGDTWHHPAWPEKDFRVPAVKADKSKNKKGTVPRKLPKKWRQITGHTNYRQIKTRVCYDCHQRILNQLFFLCYRVIQQKRECDYDKGKACLQCVRWYDKHPESFPHLMQIIKLPKNYSPPSNLQQINPS